MALDINKLWGEKTENLSRKVKAIERGDDDCYQQGMLGIRNDLLKTRRKFSDCLKYQSV